jgi:hypothetical protein
LIRAFIKAQSLDINGFVLSFFISRVGAALDLLNKNIPLEKIMLRGGWKSETSAMRYLQSWDDSNWLMIN